jgi:hypothetical protein
MSTEDPPRAFSDRAELCFVQCSNPLGAVLLFFDDQGDQQRVADWHRRLHQYYRPSSSSAVAIVPRLATNYIVFIVHLQSVTWGREKQAKAAARPLAANRGARPPACLVVRVRTIARLPRRSTFSHAARALP